MKTVKKVLDVLEAFEPQVELSIPEMVASSGLNTSTVYRICSELMQRGYLAKVANRGKYRLGQRFIKFYNSLSEVTKLKDVALVFMQKLSKDINESVSLSVLVGSEIADVACVISSHKLQLQTSEGETVPLYCTSSGKIFLSQMDSDVLYRVLKIKGMTPRTTNTITDINLLNKEITIVRKEAVAFDDEEYELGIRSVATQITGQDGNVIAALAIVGPSVRISVQRLKELVPALKACATEIIQALGNNNDAVLSSSVTINDSPAGAGR